MKRNIFLQVLIPGLMLALLAGVIYVFSRDVHETAAETTEVAVIVEDSTSGRWTRFQAGLEKAADDYNVALNYAVTGDFADIDEEVKTIRSEAAGADAVIVQLIDTSDTVDLINSLCAERVLGLVDTDAEAEAGDNFASITADNAGIGSALADLLKKTYGGELQTKAIGIVCANGAMRSIQERQTAFEKNIKEQGGSVIWTIDDPSLLAAEHGTKPADIIIALDNDSLEAAVDALGGTEASPAIYGVGCSDRTIYDLDHGTIRAMIVPDDFQMGYLAMSDVVARVSAPNIPMSHREIRFAIITRDNLYETGNASFLFPVIN